jgi:hypothetical protein
MAKRPSRSPAGPTPIESTRHKDARTNIPTQELRGFVAVEEARPPGERSRSDAVAIGQPYLDDVVVRGTTVTTICDGNCFEWWTVLFATTPFTSS